MNVAKYQTLEARACLATCTLPKKDSFFADQWATALAKDTFIRLYITVAHRPGSCPTKIPKCRTGITPELKFMPVIGQSCREIDNCPPAPWKRVWIQIQGVLQDRDQRGLAWRVLHGSVFCGAFRGYINNRIPYSDRCCPRPCCSNQPETLTHMFLTCPVAARVIRWVCDLWPAVTGGSRPVASAAVFLADDSRVWDPGTALRDLWTRIRLATLYNIWTAAQQRRRGVINNSASIVAKIIFNLRGSIYRDWQRTQEDVRMHATILSDWLRGRDPVISIAFFQDLWGPSGGLYTLIPPALPAGRPSMQIRLSCTVPIAVPLGGEHF